ncbi:MAG: 4Fe-4S dicluster domain-containing protein [bacterium]|nr:MAG: 4Fe-4S dicluster domain-containing protein [bacterium]
MDRRHFLKILGITSSSAMISSCGVDKANEKIIPYVIPPEEEVYPGKALYYHTTCTECPAHCGTQVKVNEKVYHEMRGLFATKLEGVADHPVNKGSLCARGQAGLFHLYHPDRIRRPMMRDENGNHRIVTWKEAFGKIQEGLNNSSRAGKANLFLSGLTTGTLSDLIDDFCQSKKVVRLPEYETFDHANLKAAGRIVFNQAEIPKYNIENSDFLFTIGTDIFETFLSPVNFATQYAAAKKRENFRWFHAEPHISLTGVQADQRLAYKPQTEMVLLVFLIQSILEKNRQKEGLSIEIIRSLPNYTLAQTSRFSGVSEEKLKQLSEALSQAQKPLVICGGMATAHEKGLETAILALLLQWILGIDESIIDYSRAYSFKTVGSALDIQNTVNRFDAGNIGVLFVTRTNPQSSLPPSFNFSDRMKKADLTVGFSDTMNETITNCDIILPLSHSLESWGDAVPEAGLRTIIQPAIEPQYDSLSEGDILLNLLGNDNFENGNRSYKDYLFEKWNRLYGNGEISNILQKGFATESVAKVRLSLRNRQISSFLQDMKVPADDQKNWLCLVPSIRTFDGRSHNLPLLSEIPDPLTTITYGEWVSVSVNTAKELGVKDRDEIILSRAGFSLKLPAKVQKLMADHIYMINRDLQIALDTTIDPRSGEASCFLANVEVSKTGARIPLPVLAGATTEEGRGLLPHEDEHGHGHDAEQESWYPEHEHENYRWGMAIDLESCIGCNACAAACYVENNIPIVGKEEHLRGREMSWIRIQPYIDDHDEMEFVPMMCQHCDNAPCEPVCPVYAAYHNPEGLNVQVYNRCVGTRYCANNCPYKVRRFNWFDYRLEEPLDKMYNPDISVRDRGIMEKCTFCIQRIRSAKDHAKDENRLVKDGEVIPACAQTCPTNAITFGNLEDKNSRVYMLAQSENAYQALAELGTKPAVNYLGKRGKKHEA